ncbi:MAG: hypothetical protein HQM09_18570 [Candidatus Riflebacteria bacterium]|nr:hypothetical protein [Candidatus Riflebacteria bacterium]
MKREEFETILKRALDLHGHQVSMEEDSLSEQELANAAQRLKIPPEILHRAYLEVRRSRKQFRVKGTPDAVREAFLQTFLLQNIEHSRRRPPLRVDRQALQIGRSTTVHVQHPQFAEVDAEVSFTADGTEHTLVSWTGNSKMNWKSTLFASVIPLVVLVSMSGSLMASGATLSAMFPILFIPLLVFIAVLWSSRKHTNRVEKVLTEYFENIQILGDLKEQKVAEQELLELRAWKERMSVQPSPESADTFLAKANKYSEESGKDTESAPHPTQNESA